MNKRLAVVLMHILDFIRILIGFVIYVILGAVFGTYLISIILPVLAYIIFNADANDLFRMYPRICSKISGVHYDDDSAPFGMFLGFLIFAIILFH